jgi:hypothetical protein
VIYPKLIDACNDNVDNPIEGFDQFIDCTDDSLIGLGIVTSNGAFDKESETLTRVAPLQGKNKAKPMTDLFYWSGWVLDETYDINGDGEITIDDLWQLPFKEADVNDDESIDNEDVELYVKMYGTEFTNEWIFDIADLVVYGWDYDNNGSKLVQIRFYPEDQTEYITY